MRLSDGDDDNDDEAAATNNNGESDREESGAADNTAALSSRVVIERAFARDAQRVVLDLSPWRSRPGVLDHPEVRGDVASNVLAYPQSPGGSSGHARTVTPSDSSSSSPRMRAQNNIAAHRDKAGRDRIDPYDNSTGNGRCIWCEGRGARPCPWCRGVGTRPEARIAWTPAELNERLERAARGDEQARAELRHPPRRQVTCRACSGERELQCGRCGGTGRNML